MSIIDWPAVAIIFAMVAVLILAARLLVQEERRAIRRKERELHQRAEEAFYFAISEKYKPTLTPEEVAFHNGPAWR